MRRTFPRPSPSLVIAVIALFVALGGTPLANVLLNGADLKNGSVTGTKLQKGTLTGTQIRNGSLTGTQIRRGSLTGTQVRNGSLTGTQVRKDSLTGTQIRESTLGQVPSAVDADTVGGRSPTTFEPASQWALIAGSAAGAIILAGSRDLTVARSSAGTYIVGTLNSVAAKPLSATLNQSSAGSIAVAPCGGAVNNPGGFNCPVSNDNQHVIVVTQNPAGTPSDATFYVSIGG